ncbi:alpha/beta fold hydrolase [Devosia sp.]|uniref:alpha/beta fold hydrolase n=1 Tax=Devosia sp. TaxID=1871048 RepID=UPI002EFAB5B4
MNAPIPTLYFEDSGDGARPALLLVHGLLSSRNHWLPNIERLGRAFRLIRIDLPAHGRSPGASAPALHPDNIAGALDALREQLGIDRWYICGQSLGAGITLRYALARPDRIIAQAFTNANAALKPQLAGSARAALRDRVDGIRRGGAEALRREVVHPRHARRFPDDVREALCADADALDPAGVADMLEHTLPYLGLADRLAEIAVPTLLVNGTYERKFQPLRAMAASVIPRLRVADVAGGHSINVENAAGFDQAILELPALAAGRQSSRKGNP